MQETPRVVGTAPPELAVGVRDAARLQTLEEVLRAGFDVVAIVVQDEYTHDVVTRRGGAPGFVVFDTT